MSRYRDEEFYPRSVPISVQGGIVARTGRGQKFGATWWASRWIGMLESFGWESRLQRGRAYARRGQVISIDLAPGHVRAHVQGSVPRPYSVSIDVQPLSDEAWERVTQALAERAIFAARLLAGEMPQDIEEAFAAAGTSLFPTSAREIKTRCSCPDVANPCKHIAAVYYLLGEAFDRDPFILFRLRGRTQEEIVTALRARRAAEAGPEPAAPPAEAVATPAEAPLEACLDRYWSPAEAIDDMQFSIARPAVPLALLKRLGDPPFWPSGDQAPSLQASLGPVYEAVTRAALDLAFGEDGNEEEAPDSADSQE